MTYTRSQNYITMVVGKHETPTFKVVTFVLLFLLLLLDIFAPTNAHPFIFLNKWFVQMHLNMN